MTEQQDNRIQTNGEARQGLVIAAAKHSEGRNPVSEFDPDMPAELREEMETVSASRRDFMKVTGMAAMGAVIAGCTAQDMHVKPLLQKPEGITPGVSYHYASTCRMCSANCGTLMKVRDGRPIKAEGNPDDPRTRGALCSKGQAQLWNLYNPDRLHGPWAKDTPEDWEERSASDRWSALDSAARAAVGAGNVRLLTGTVSGPATREAIRRFVEATGARHVSYDAVSAWPIAAAHRDTHGVAVVPGYRFDRADVVVSFGADFLGTWISPVEYARQWSSKRDLKFGKKEMSRHIQLESRMSTTGACADERFRVRNAARGAALVDLANRLGGSFGAAGEHGVAAEDMQRIAAELKAANGRALVVCDSDNVAHQKLVNWINNTLGAYGSTLDLRNPTRSKLGNDEQLAELIREMDGGNVSTLVIWGVNPVFDLPEGARFKEALGKVANKIAIGSHADETTSACDWIAAEDDQGESWGDAEPQRGLYTLAQPTIRRLWDTRTGAHSLLRWAGDTTRDYREFVKAHWEANVLGGASWESAVETGVLDKRGEIADTAPVFREAANLGNIGAVESGDGLEVVLFESYNLGDGRHANNGWLHEIADPLNRVSWTNFAGISPVTMEKLGLSFGDMVEVKVGDATCRAPVTRAPGQAEDTVSLPLGYGRKMAGRISHGMGTEQDAYNDGAIGDNAWPLLKRGGVSFGSATRVGKYHRLAFIQEHDCQEGRPLAKETPLALWLENPKSGNEHEIPPVDFTLWPQWEFKGHKWGLVVDLNLCTGCNACIVACNTENNIPVVGKDEVWRRREMHWMRIDRYFEDTRNDEGKPVKDGKLTKAENPEVVFQPMMCQHCDNAPCETVCPVIATSQSDEGLNVQTYNRCIGTRYCANNCPYKVRRFNWFTYKHRDLTMNLSLNPDITIRSQGVMEKCTMCTQRIYDGKRDAARQGRKPRDGEIKTACQQTCPTEAIVFGDVNDAGTRIAELRKDPRNYGVIEEINTQPAVTYLTKVRNRPVREYEKQEQVKHGGH